MSAKKPIICHTKKEKKMLVLKTLPENARLIEPDQPEEFGLLFRLRWEMLRKPWGLPPGSEKDSEEEGSVHRAIWLSVEGKSVAVACGRMQLALPQEAQVRYMAVDSRFQGKGWGREVLQSLEEEAGNLGCSKVFLNAREKAVPFYLRCGYIIENEAEAYLGIPHFRMSRQL